VDAMIDRSTSKYRRMRRAGHPSLFCRCCDSPKEEKRQRLHKAKKKLRRRVDDE